MAKGKSRSQAFGPAVPKYPYPSRFGSRRSMVVKTCEDETRCVCLDEFGEYETDVTRLDNGLADPNRFDEDRITKLFQSRKEKKG